MDVKEINVLSLAYLGDSIYEVYVRRFLMKNMVYVKDMQEEAIKYVSAKAQAAFLEKLVSNNLLTEEEMDVMRRARNYKATHHPKNCDILTYKHSTAFEAIIGYLDIVGNNKRIDEIINLILEDKLC